MPAEWQTTLAGSTTGGAAVAWWERFGDPQLAELVRRAFTANLDLDIARARIEEAAALRRVASADLWPRADARLSGNAIKGHQPSLYLAGLEALWELDVFGGQRRSVEAAEADIEAAIGRQRAVAVAIAGEVARAYIEMRGLQRRSATVRKNLVAQQDTRDLTEAQLRAGLASDLDVERARAQVASTAAELPAIEAGIRQNSFRLGVLLGQHPAALLEDLDGSDVIPAVPAEVVISVPAELLRRRPDVLVAERELAAATARIGEAKADLYPRFTLTGSIGLRSEDVVDLVRGKGGLAAIGPDIVWPVFAAGRIVANVEVQNARQEQARARYQLVVLRALEEVENAMTRYASEQLRRRDLAAAVDANREAAELARRLHASGLIGFLDVLDAERSLLTAESLFVASDTAVSANLVALYVALGGGWEEAQRVSLQ